MEYFLYLIYNKRERAQQLLFKEKDINMERTPAAELHQIKKYFGTVKANDGVDLTIRNNEIHAILGENGSGKSTLMNILSGLYSPDSGEILIGGEKTQIRSPKEAMEKGIGMIHQHFKLVDALTAWENIIGGLKRGLFLNKKNAIAQIKELCAKYKLSLDPEKKIYQMTIGEKQTVEIVKALFRGARIMILDEPTAVLTVQETAKLFDILREMKENGCAVIIITHKLNEVMEVSDRVTILRKGVSVASIETKEVEPKVLAELMVGRKVDITVPYEDTSDKRRKPILTIKDLKIKGSNGVNKLDIDKLDINTYEILGVAGVADSGQNELCEAIVGLQKAKGSIIYEDEEIVGQNPCSMAKKHINIGFVPEDRLGTGLAGALTITDNVAIRSYKDEKGPFINKRKERIQAERLIRHYDVSTPSADHPIKNLSGGNIQKVLLGREIDRGASLLIAAYPVRGLDIGAMDFIYEKLNEEKKKGVAILFIGEDLDMLLGLCDRIAVLHSGKLMDIVDAKSITKEELGLLMMGHREENK